MVLALLCAAIVSAQTRPVAQALPYTQNFGMLAHSSNTYPEGWQGWRIFTGATTTYITDAPTADVPLTANANAANNSGALYNYNGKMGILNATGMNAALVLSINTTHRFNVQVGYTLMTIRNPWDGSTNTRRNRTTLQYRIGNEGPFTAVEVLSYGTGTTAQTGSVTTPLDPANFSATLPAICSYQQEVQLRWVTRDSTGTGARPSIALDDVSVDGTWFPMYTGGDGRGDASGSYQPPAPLADIFRGGNGRGDVSASFVAPPPTASIFKGGDGRGDVSASFTAPPITASIFRGGDGRGDIAGSFVAPPPTASIFKGGDGRGDVSGSFTTPPLAASIYSGGVGRGDIAGSFVAPPPTASIFKGGDGRGDVSGSFTAPPVTASIYRGGDGRGDIAGSFVTPPLTASIFKGGDGRGDVSGSFTTPPLSASIYRGGDGRGDIAGSFVTPPSLANIFRGGVGRGDVSMALVLFEPLAITTVLEDEYLCTGLPFEVAFVATGAFNTGNVFTAQLSDEVGDFSNALTIGSITGTSSDTIMATIPNGTLESYGYRIRVVADDPVLVGTDNGAYLFVLDGSTDSDGDGEPDCLDTCPWLPGLSDGQPCDDGDPNTINDVVSNCYCQGCTPARFGYDQGHLAVCDAAPDFTFTCWNLNAPGVFTSTWSLNGVDLGQPDNTTIAAPNPGPGEHTYLLIADNECGVDTFYLHVSVRGAFTAGSDSTYTTCNATGGFLMNDLLSSDADIGGTWFNADINFGPGYIPYFQALETTAGTYLNGYTFESPGCTPDTAWITVIITDGGIYAYHDVDHDGYGDANNAAMVCEVGPGYSLNSDDCNDADPNLTVPGNPCDDGNPATIDDVVTAECTCVGTPSFVAVQVRMLLDGPFNAAAGLMHDSLRTQGLTPLNEPYTALGFDLPGGGGESVAPAVLAEEGPDAIVDWVVVELHDAGDAALVEAARCFLVQRDGDVVDAMGGTTLLFGAAQGEHYLAVRHRNHLGVMSRDPIELGAAATFFDVGAPATPVHGADARRMVGPYALLWSGDATGDGRVQYTGDGNDRDPILEMIGGVVPTSVMHDVYAGEDVNMDGRVQYTGDGNDRDPILQNIGGVVPTQVRFGQLP